MAVRQCAMAGREIECSRLSFCQIRTSNCVMGRLTIDYKGGLDRVSRIGPLLFLQLGLSFVSFIVEINTKHFVMRMFRIRSYIRNFFATFIVIRFFFFILIKVIHSLNFFSFLHRGSQKLHISTDHNEYIHRSLSVAQFSPPRETCGVMLPLSTPSGKSVILCMCIIFMEH